MVAHLIRLAGWIESYSKTYWVEEAMGYTPFVKYTFENTNASGYSNLQAAIGMDEFDVR